MAEKKYVAGKATPKKRASNSKLLCTAKLSDGKPCPKTAENGKSLCRWHDPEDETWRDVYARLEKSTPEGKKKIVLKLIDDHPEHRLILPERDYQKADLKNINLYEGEEGEGYDLENADLSGADLESADLRFTVLDGSNLNSVNLQAAILSGASLLNANLNSANLQNAEILGAWLSGANLFSANLNGTELWGSDLKGANLSYAKLQGVDLTQVELSDISIFNAWLDKTRIEREQLGSAIGDEREGNYGAAKQGYLTLKQNFDDLGDYDAASWAYRKERRMEKLEALQQKKYLRYLSDTIVEWLCDYGESVWRVIGWMAFLVFVVGPPLFSVLGGIDWSQHPDLVDKYLASLGLPKYGLWYQTYLLYTLDTMTTASFSGLQPINVAVKFASGFFAIAGIVLAGLLGFVAGNRIRRS